MSAHQSPSRRFLIAGNWKMNKTSGEAFELVAEVLAGASQQTTVDVAVCPAFPVLDAAGRALAGSAAVALGAQNVHPEPNGAFTGEVSAEMLKNLGVRYVILGHSERREYFAETDAFINRKVHAVLKAGMRPVLCVGETLQQREAGQTLSVVQTQLRGGLQGVTEAHASEVVIAYEPVWAIGTGRTATPEMAEEVHREIRCELARLIGTSGAEKVRILYGGSMKPSNADGLLAMRNIDGGLIGGASLKASEFNALIDSARRAQR